MKEKELTYQVIAVVGGSNERVVLFESKDHLRACEVCEDYMRNPRKAKHITRDYLSGWGSGIDDFFVWKKQA